jgi:hypothetical protein
MLLTAFVFLLYLLRSQLRKYFKVWVTVWEWN